jgi:HJR/Mrr/RecB family endonuclease
MSKTGLLSFQVGALYSSDDIQRGLSVGNAGGVRLSVSDDGSVRRAVILTSVPTARQLSENPYHDRIENNILVYTGAGREGDQTLGGVNKRLPQQLNADFPIYGFVLIGSRRDPKVGPKRWRFLGLLEHLRHYPDAQCDTSGILRKVWLFEMRIHTRPESVTVADDAALSARLLLESRRASEQSGEDQEIGHPPLDGLGDEREMDPTKIESIRGRLLATPPEKFEHFVKDLMVASGFAKVSVTKFSQDGGVDVNAHASSAMWLIEDMRVQVQAKRWLHTVGRKEVAELRGSLEPFARGAVVTTSHYSKAAIVEAGSPGKAPIVLIDGYSLARLTARFGLDQKL